VAYGREKGGRKFDEGVLVWEFTSGSANVPLQAVTNWRQEE